jgi:hypothetical protein
MVEKVQYFKLRIFGRHASESFSLLLNTCEKLGVNKVDVLLTIIYRAFVATQKTDFGATHDWYFRVCSCRMIII